MKHITKIQYFDNSIQSHKLRVDKFFNTNVTHISNGVDVNYKDKDQQITFYDDQYVYKSYIFNKTLQSTVEKKENEIKRAEEDTPEGNKIYNDLKDEFADLFFNEKDENFEAAAMEKTIKYPMN